LISHHCFDAGWLPLSLPHDGFFVIDMPLRLRHISRHCLATQGATVTCHYFFIAAS